MPRPIPLKTPPPRLRLVSIGLCGLILDFKPQLGHIDFLRAVYVYVCLINNISVRGLIVTVKA